jgi:hypothetical protein
MRRLSLSLIALLAAAPSWAARVEISADVARPDFGQTAALTGPSAVLAPSVMAAPVGMSASPVAMLAPVAAPMAAPAAAPVALAAALPTPAALPVAAAVAAAPDAARAPPVAAVAASPVAGHAAALAYADPATVSSEEHARQLDALFDGGWSTQRFPVARGEIGWKQALSMALPGSKVNTVRTGYKSTRDREIETDMWTHNLGYVLGLKPRDYNAQQLRDNRQKRLAKLVERGALVRAAYHLPPFESLTLPLVTPGRKLGEGGQGKAYAVEGDPTKALKTFNRTAGPQMQEYAAIMNSLHDQGQPVPRVRLVQLPDGTVAMEMPRYDRTTGWSELASRARFHPKDPAVIAGDAIAQATLRAVTRETERTLGVDAADWKQGFFGGGDGDEYLENFAIQEKTGAIAAFDPLALW